MTEETRTMQDDIPIAEIEDVICTATTFLDGLYRGAWPEKEIVQMKRLQAWLAKQNRGRGGSNA